MSLMSLKPFHGLFMAAATLISIAFGGWALGQFVEEGTAALIVVALCAAGFALIPAAYVLWTTHKFGGPSLH